MKRLARLVAVALVACGGGALELGPDHPASPDAAEAPAPAASAVLESGAELDAVAPVTTAPSTDHAHHHHHPQGPASATP